MSKAPPPRFESAYVPAAAAAFVRGVDRFNHRIGRMAMYLLFVLMAILAWSTFSKAFLHPSLWTLEMAQFVMVAYYILGGAYVMQMGDHVRMDLFYTKRSPKGQALWDAITVFALIFYMAVMLWGAIDSTIYAFQYNERSPTAWRPYMWPIKITICLGFTMMLMQAIAALIRDIATLRSPALQEEAR